MKTYDTLDLRTLVTSSGDDRKNVTRSYLRFATTGVEFFAALAALALLGIWLDGRFHTAPVLTIVLTFVGFGAATYNLLRSVDRFDPPKHEPDQRR